MIKRSRLTIWHKLLIYYLREKNRIIKYLVGINYIFDEDIEEIKGWSKENIKASISRIGHSTSDIANCPWCIYFNKLPSRWNLNSLCRGCKYGARHGCCRENGSNYIRILESLRKLDIISNSECHVGGICSILDVVNLSKSVKTTYEILLKILPFL